MVRRLRVDEDGDFLDQWPPRLLRRANPGGFSDDQGSRDRSRSPRGPDEGHSSGGSGGDPPCTGSGLSSEQGLAASLPALGCCDAGLKWRELKSYRRPIERLHRAAIKRAGVGPIGEMPWIEYAAVEHRREPLHAILSQFEQTGAPFSTTERSTRMHRPGMQKRLSRYDPPRRTFYRRVRLLLHQVQEVHVVDPYLDATPDYVRTLENVPPGDGAQRRASGSCGMSASGVTVERAGGGTLGGARTQESDLQVQPEGLLGSELRASASSSMTEEAPRQLPLDGEGRYQLWTGFAARKDREPINVFLLSPDKAKKDLEKFRALSNGNIAFSVGGPAALRL